jgi:hypothetical protein
MVEWWRSCRCARDGDQCAKIGHTMSHIVYACDVYPLWILFCFDRDGSIIRWSLTLNFKIKCVLPSYAPLRKIVILKHHVMIGCYKLYVHIQRVQASFCTRQNTWVKLDKPSMYRHGLGTHGPKGQAWVIWMIWSTCWCSPIKLHHSRDDRSWCSEFGSCFTKQLRGMLNLVGVH